MSIVGGLIIGKIVDKAVDIALGRIVASKNIAVTSKEAPAIKEAVVKEVVERVEPVVQNITNKGPLYKSRVFLGTLFAALAAVAQIGTMYTDDVPNSVDEYMTQIAIIVPVLYAMYGRIVNKKPLWTR